MFSFLRPTTTFSVLLLFSSGPVFAPAQDDAKKAQKEEARYRKQLAAEEARYAKQRAAEEANYLKAAVKAAKEQAKAAQTPEEIRAALELAKAIKEQAQGSKEPKPESKKPEAPVAELPSVTARPEMFGYGHWPKGTPTWFIQLDDDHDGQVGLYEWHARGLRVADYQTLDLNDDGLLTFEEWFRWTEQQANAGLPTTWSPPGFTRDKPSKGNRGR